MPIRWRPPVRCSVAALRERLPALAETGGRVVVCGGGATGIEAAAEFATAYPRCGSTCSRGAGSRSSWARRSQPISVPTLERQGVTIQDETTIGAVRPGIVETTAGPVPYDVCLWTGGFVAPPLAREAGLAVNERGQIWVDPFMRSVSHPAILAVGDAAQPVEDPSVPVRMSAFTALILGAHGADCLAARLRGRRPARLASPTWGRASRWVPTTPSASARPLMITPTRPTSPGAAGYTIREVGVRLLAHSAALDRRLPGGFTWTGKGRYAALRRVADAEAG